MLWFHPSLWINRVSSYTYTFLNLYSQIHFLTIVTSPVKIVFSSHIFFPYILIYPQSCYFILCANILVQFFSSLLHLSSKTLYTSRTKIVFCYSSFIAMFGFLYWEVVSLWRYYTCLFFSVFFLCCVWRCLYSSLLQSPSFLPHSVCSIYTRWVSWCIPSCLHAYSPLSFCRREKLNCITNSYTDLTEFKDLSFSRKFLHSLLYHLKGKQAVLVCCLTKM